MAFHMVRSFSDKDPLHAAGSTNPS